ncbi:MAG: hypothetical protein BWY64_01013 [bacterium ADurb.Bin363]|nr:MAG: hypothetical protein BWY64_01013 [bacterium ADurb.Bin363]
MTKKNWSSKSIYINTLIDITKNEINFKELSELCIILKRLYKKLILIYENLQIDKANKDTRKLREQLAYFHKLISNINKYPENKNKELLYQNINKIVTITEDLFYILTRMREKEKKITPPSKSPLMSELILAVKAVHKGELPYEALKEKINFLKEFIESTKKQIYPLSWNPDSVTFLEEYEKVLININLYQEGLNYLKNRDKHHIEKGIDIILKATEKLFTSLGLLYESADIITKVICLRCGHKNSLYRDTCAICRSLLPKVAQTGTDGKHTETYEIKNFEYIITDNLKELMEVTKEIEDGKITKKDFNNILKEMEKKLKHVRDELKGKNMKIIPEIYRLFKDSLKDMKHGIKIMKNYTKDENPDHLDTGLNEIFEASRKISTLQNLGIEAERELSRRDAKRER